VAGTGTAGYNGDNIAATSAELKTAYGVAVDLAGNLYIGDYGNARVREVAAGSGMITTVAGTGTAGYNGDGIAATTAAIRPYGIAVDASGNIYIADYTNGRVREVFAATGTIKTVAGIGTAGYSGDSGPATSAKLYYPTGVAVDATGNIYIADTRNYRVRMVAAGTGTITTLAGTGTNGYSGDNGPAASAEVISPSSLAVDTSGNVYISTGYRVREVVAGSGTITTVAGTGTVGLPGDNGAALNATLSAPTCVLPDGNGNVYVCDANEYRVRKISMVTGTITTVAGNGTGGYSGDNGPATSAQILAINGLALDASGNLYLAGGDNRVRKVAAGTGIITTVAGTGAAGYNGDNIAATSAELNYANGVAVDASGNLYIADELNNRVRMVSAATGMITTFAGTGSGVIYNGQNIPATSANIYYPTSVAVDSSGNVYIADSSNILIRKVAAGTGIITNVAGVASTPGYNGDGIAATSAELNHPAAVAVDGSGNLYISDFANARVRKVTAATGIISTVAGTGISGFSGDGGAATSAQINNVQGVGVDANGLLYIADTNNNRVRVVYP
jgi:sugar lactone lactonase YvrE